MFYSFLQFCLQIHFKKSDLNENLHKKLHRQKKQKKNKKKKPLTGKAFIRLIYTKGKSQK